MTTTICVIRRILVIILTLFILFFYVNIAVIAQDAQTSYQDGYQYFSQGEYQKAEESYQKAIDLNPSFEDAHYWLGKVYRQIGEHNKAAQQWIEVLKINPRNPYAFRYLNDSFGNTSAVNSDNAGDYLNEGIKRLDVADDAFLHEDDYSSFELLQAIPYFKKALELENNLIVAHYWLAELYQILSKKISWQYTSIAISSFEKAIQIEEEQHPYAFERPSEYWYSYQELIIIYKSLGLNERRENLIAKLKEVKTAPYVNTLTQAGYDGYGYPDQIEIIEQGEELIELWKYKEENKVFRVIDKEVVGEELSSTPSQENAVNLSEERIEDLEVINEN
ncbi:MAG: tetratricopeptide repeat protein [Atribacterota bacterium]